MVYNSFAELIQKEIFRGIKFLDAVGLHYFQWGKNARTAMYILIALQQNKFKEF